MTSGLTLPALAMTVVMITTGAAWVAYAQEGARQPDITHGEQIAAQGTRSGATACAQCHAFNGASDGTGAFPRIAGQSAMYLTKQLESFGSGERVNSVMTPIAKTLAPDELADVAAYYASVAAPFLPLSTSSNAALLKRGQQLAQIGDASMNLQSCNNCHGPGGAGQPPAIPYLAGQYSHYTAFQLQMWKRGFRKTSQGGMVEVAKKLSDEDIQAVADYFQQVLDHSPPANPSESGVHVRR
jgi:cytochrome c553